MIALRERMQGLFSHGDMVSHRCAETEVIPRARGWEWIGNRRKLGPIEGASFLAARRWLAGREDPPHRRS